MKLRLVLQVLLVAGVSNSSPSFSHSKSIPGLKNGDKIFGDLVIQLYQEAMQETSRPSRDISHHSQFTTDPRHLQSLDTPDLPPDVPEGFDLNNVEPGPDGTFCVFKTVPIEGIEKNPVQECIHRVDHQCHVSYVTQFTPATEELCSETYKKKCFVDFSKQSHKELVEKCYQPQERVCEPPKYGEVPNEVCQTQYETACITNWRDTPVVENVEECNKVYKKKCEYVNKGYSSTLSKVCHNEPVKACQKVPKTIIKNLPFTKCERLPFEACAPDNCKYVPGELQCHNKTVDIGIDVPEEVCDVQPQKKCEQVYRLVPKLHPQEVCYDVPREVCTTSLKNPQAVTTPLLTKWCFTPEEPEVTYEPYPVPEHPPPPQHYGEPAYPAPQYEEAPPPSYEQQHHPEAVPVYEKYTQKKYGYRLVEQPPQTPPPQSHSYGHTTAAPSYTTPAADTEEEHYTDIPAYRHREEDRGGRPSQTFADRVNELGSVAGSFSLV